MMPRSTYRKEKDAKGMQIGDKLKIAVLFEEHDFQQIVLAARLNKVSFQEQVRRFCRAQLYSQS